MCNVVLRCDRLTASESLKKEEEEEERKKHDENKK